MVHILREGAEFEILGDAVQCPGFRHGLERADQHLAGVLFVVGAFVGDAQDGKFAKARDRLGHDVEMFAGLQRHVHARHQPDLAAPHASAVDDHVAGDGALVLGGFPVNGGHAVARAVDAGDGGVFGYHCAAHPRAAGQSHRDAGRVALSVLGQPDAAHDARQVEVRIAAADLGGVDLLDLDPKGAGHGSEAGDFLHPLRRQRGGDGAHAAEPGGDAGFGFKFAVEFLGVFGEPGHVRRRAELRDQTSGVPCGAGGELLAFQEHDITPAQRGQVIGHGTADGAATDDDDAGMGGKGHGYMAPNLAR